MVEARAHARLRGEVEDAVDTVERKLVLRHVQAQDLERMRVLQLQRRVVVVREEVDRDDLVAARQQRLGEVRAHEACGAGDEVAAHVPRRM